MVRITNQRKAAFLEKQDSKEDKILSIKSNMAYGQPPENMVNSYTGITLSGGLYLS